MSLYRRLRSHSIGADDAHDLRRITASPARPEADSPGVATASAAYGGEPG